MIKKFLLWLLTFLLLVSFASAIPVSPDGADSVSYWKMENLTDELGVYDLTAFSSPPSSTGIINNGYDLDGSADYFSFNDFSLADDFSYSQWINPDTWANGGLNTIVTFDGTGTSIFYIRDYCGGLGPTDGCIQASIIDSSGNSCNIYSGDVIIEGGAGWNHIVTTFDGTRGVIYHNGAVVANESCTANGFVFDDFNYIGTNGAGRFLNGDIDEVTIANVAYNSNNVDFLYNGGNPGTDQQYPFLTTNVTTNSSTESTAVVKQVGSVSFVGATTIISSNFNVTNNNTPLYGGYSFNVESNNVNVVRCELFIDGVSQSNVTRSQQTGVLGSVFIQSDVLMLDEGEHNQSLVCRRQSGLGLTTVSNAVGIGHFLVDEFNNTLPYNDTAISGAAVSSGSSYSLIDSFNVTVGNQTSADNLTHNLVVEGQLTYTNNGVSSQVLGAYIEINGSNSSFYPRSVASGTTGSVALDFIIENATTNQTYTVNIYANGTNAVYNGNFVVKDLFIDKDEIEGGTGIITGFNFTGNTDTRIFNISAVGNFNHPVANAFLKASYSVLTDVDTTVTFYIKLIDGTNFTTVDFTRDYVAGQIGVVAGHDIFENVPLDPNYQVELWANCGTVGATCTIVGGSSFGYITDITSVILNSFNITAYDNWTLQTINNFTVSNSAFFNTTTGLVQFFSENEFENITISSNGYFDEIFLNYNTSQDLNVSMKQSDIKFRATEIITGDYVSPANFTIDGVTKGVNQSFYLSEGTYNVTFSKNGWYNNTQEFTVSSLDNKTVIVSDVSDTIINITTKHFFDNTSINTFNGYIYHVETDTNISFSTTSGSALVNAANGTTFNIFLQSDGYASYNDELTVNNTPVFSYEAILYEFNSIYITIYDLLTNSIINTQNVDIDVISDVYSTQTNTSNGTKYFTLLTPEDYELRFSSDGYVTSSYFIAVNNDSSQNLNVYLLNSTGTYNVSINVVDESAQNVEGAIVKASRYDISSNTFKLYSAGTTNSDGEVVLSLTFNDEYYKFTVEVGGETKKVTSPQYITGSTLVIQVILSDLAGTDYFNYLGIDSSLVFNTLTNNFRLTYNDLDGLGDSYCLYVYRLDIINGDTLVNSSCSSSSSGTILLGVNSVNGTTYVARAFYDDNFLIDASYTFPDSTTSGELGLFMQLFLTLAFCSVAFADLGLLPIAIGASLIFGKMAMLNSFGWPGIAAFMVVMIVISVSMYGFRG